VSLSASVSQSYPRWVPNLSESKPVDYGINGVLAKPVFDRHYSIEPMLRAGYLGKLLKENYVHANRQLLSIDSRLMRGDLNLSMDDSDVKDFCRAKARGCKDIIIRHRPENAEKLIRAKLVVYGIEYKADIDLVWSDFERFQDECWWRRQVRKIQARELDEIARSMRIVHAKKQIYTSTNNVLNRRKQNARNRALMSEYIATNQEGQEYTLQELSDLSVSNPEIRRSELMVRIAGFEKVADARDMVGEFYTLTCPSKYHPMLTSYQTYTENGNKKKRFKGCYENPNYKGATVRDAQKYLSNLFARIRADLARRGIGVFGFRVSEAHHDGCPHWHLLLFMARGDSGPCRSVFRKYALLEDGGEVGALKHRFKAERIDKSKGTAAGYIAKYISKNINGVGMEGENDLFGVEVVGSSERVQAWASCHGVRQFQQIGGPCVGVWRELRRLASEDCPESIEGFRAAADASDWAAYVELMGGPFCGRNQELKMARWHEVDTETGEFIDAPVGRYGDDTEGKIIGLLTSCGEVICTRFYSWVVERSSRIRQSVLTVSESLHSMTLDDLVESGFFSVYGAQAPPWSPVNNCTVS